MTFQDWFNKQFGPQLQSESLQDLQNQIDSLREKLDHLEERRLKLVEVEALKRGAYYAWNANKSGEIKYGSID